MTFPDFWHWLTTSRYTRRLEEENSELRAQLKDMRAENQALIFALKHGVAVPVAERETIQAPIGGEPMPAVRRRPGKFVGFSQVKKRLESQEPLKGA